MKLQTKKVIAKEFLVLTLCLALGTIAFLCTYPYNFYNRNQIYNWANKIQLNQNVADSLSKPYDIKNKNQKWFYDKMSEKYDLDKLNSINLWWEHSANLAKTDSIKIRWKTIWSKASDPIPFFNKIGFTTPDSLQNFLKANSINDIDIKNNQTAKEAKEYISSLKKQIEKHQAKILSYSEQVFIGYKSVIISLFIFFILRYFYWAVKWSIKTLKGSK